MAKKKQKTGEGIVMEFRIKELTKEAEEVLKKMETISREVTLDFAMQTHLGQRIQEMRKNLNEFTNLAGHLYRGGFNVHSTQSLRTKEPVGRPPGVASPSHLALRQEHSEIMQAVGHPYSS